MFDVLCMCVCPCEQSHVYTYICTCEHMEIDIEYLPQLPSNLFFERQSLSELGACQFGSWLSSKPQVYSYPCLSRSRFIDVPHHICLAFLNVDLGKLNSGPHAFLSESSLHPLSTYGEPSQG